MQPRHGSMSPSITPLQTHRTPQHIDCKLAWNTANLMREELASESLQLGTFQVYPYNYIDPQSIGISVIKDWEMAISGNCIYRFDGGCSWMPAQHFQQCNQMRVAHLFLGFRDLPYGSGGCSLAMFSNVHSLWITSDHQCLQTVEIVLCLYTPLQTFLPPYIIFRCRFTVLNHIHINHTHICKPWASSIDWL